MVAMTAAVAEPVPMPADWVATRRVAQVRLTRQAVDAMVRSGTVPEDAATELLHGALVRVDRAKAGEDVSTVGDEHTLCVELLAELRPAVAGEGRHARSQTPLVCTDMHEPFPDFFVVRGRVRDYPSKPTAADALCVVEVADSSYGRDVGEKLYGYARAGVPQYVIVDLRNRRAEVYVNPDRSSGTYDGPTIVAADGVLSLRVGDAGETFAVGLADVLP